MEDARRAVASKVGSAVVDGRGMRAVANHRGQPQAIVQAREDCNKYFFFVKAIIHIM